MTTSEPLRGGVRGRGPIPSVPPPPARQPMRTPPADAVQRGWVDPITDPHRKALEICHELSGLLRSMQLPGTIGGSTESLFDILGRQVGSLETQIRLHYALEQRIDAVDYSHLVAVDPQQGYTHRHAHGSKPHEHE